MKGGSIDSNNNSTSQDISSIKLHSFQTNSATSSQLKQTLPIPDPNQLTSSIVTAVRRWILSFALINFDLDQGPDFDNCYPPLELTNNQMSNISFSSFPDCAKGGSLIFSWRIPGITKTTQSSQNSSSILNPNQNSTTPDPKTSFPSSSTTGHFNLHSKILSSLSYSPQSDLYGYVYFVQEKDPSVLRGYNQHSLVLITHLSDYVGLFSTLVSRLGPLYATQGTKCLEMAIQNIASWPDVIPGTNPELSFLGQRLKFTIPLKNQTQIPEPQPKASTRKILHVQDSRIDVEGQRDQFIKPPIEYSVLASNPTTYLSYILFGSHASSYSSNTHPSNFISVSSLWVLWELLVLAEPLIVFGSTPDIVSDTVLHLKNLIRPIPFHANWRPYITIHDPDFPVLFTKNTKTRTVGLLGVTNPIILSNINAWSNVLSLTNQQGGCSNHHIGLITDRKRVLQKDKQVVKQLQFCLDQKDYHQADVIISRHFSLLTEQFLQPLQRYFTTLLPADRPSSEPERTRSFNSDLFLKSLKEHTTALVFRSRLTAGLNGSVVSIPGFYTSFLRSPNFSAWLQYQMDLADLAVRNRYLVRLQTSTFDLNPWPNNPHPHLHRPVNGVHNVTKELPKRSYSTAPPAKPNHSRSISIMRSNSLRTNLGPKKMSRNQPVQQMDQVSETAKNQDLNKK